MCSIEGTTDSRFDIELFCKLNKFRGPDDTNTYITRNIQLGHNLLSISPNKENIPQPFVTEKNNVLCFNGEIYGLEDNVFDTEWLANKIEKEGVESLGKGVNGMWAFAWFNEAENTVTLCRDHFGQKPLYYMLSTVQDRDLLYFSSTVIPLAHVLKGIGTELELDDDGVSTIKERGGFQLGDKTVYKGIKRLMPGEILTIKLDQIFEYKKDNLWNHDSDFNLFPNYMWNKEEFEHITKKAILQTCHAPTIKKSLSLSGGLDSSLIASVAKNEDKFSASTVTWEDTNIGKKDSERHLLTQLDLANETCRKNALPLHIRTIKFSDKDDKILLQEIRKAMGYIPAWDSQRLMPRFVNITQSAARQNKIYITGDCADEILTGYNGDYNKWCDPKRHKNHIDDDFNFYLTRDKAETTSYVNQFSHLMSVDLINNGAFANLLMHCDGFCTVIDSMCGYYGMESRTPFLHQEFVKYAMKIPGQEKLRIPYLTKERKKGYKFMKDHQFFLLGHYKGLFRENFKTHYVDNVRNFDRKVGLSNPWNSRNSEINNKLIADDIPKNYSDLKLISAAVSDAAELDEYTLRRPHLNSLGVDFRDLIQYNGAKYGEQNDSIF